MPHVEVAIPTRGRSGPLSRLTLPWLRRGGVDPSQITLFCQGDDPELPAYRALAATRNLPEVVVHDRPGMIGQRAAIAAHYPRGTWVAEMDDDITALRRGVDPKTMVDVEAVADWLHEAFRTTVGLDLWAWGVSAVPNPFYLKPGRVTDGLRFCVGTLHGFIARPGHPVHDLSASDKEDYEFSLRSWWWDGGIVRFGDVAVLADHYRLPGGCVDIRTPDTAEVGVTQLLADWPGLVRRNPRRASGYPEVLLSTKGRRLPNPDAGTPPGRAQDTPTHTPPSHATVTP